MLANLALDGLEKGLREKYPPTKRLRGEYLCVNVVRYADDFVVTGRTKELLEREIKPLIERFLRERGLELSPDKTVITHIKDGFDFLGQNVRKYRNRKLLIKPSRKSIRVLLEGVRGVIRDSQSLTAAQLITRLNPRIQGWANYHRHVVSKRVFAQVDDAIFRALWQWARRRHPMKTSDWTMRKYFGRRGNRSWWFFGTKHEEGSGPDTVWLFRAVYVPIRRHIKVQRDAHPYDPVWESYFSQRTRGCTRAR